MGVEMEFRFVKLTVLLSLLMVSCSKQEPADAFGQFEADEIVVSAEVNGRLMEVHLEEGQTVDAGFNAAKIDTTTLQLQKEELITLLRASESRLEQLAAEKKVLQSQLQTAEKELSRVQALHQDQAATQSQLDRAEGEVNTLNRRIEAMESQRQTIIAERERTNARIKQVNDQIERATVRNPVRGTVLHTYKEAGELAMAGTPLYRIADLSRMTLRVYISGAQLSDVALGEDVTVQIDKNKEEYEQMIGTVTWISPEAEFTPQMIQTKEERVTQVYAVKIRVDNPEGILKIGMPGEVKFNN
jgi:HlyD family secretion protein